MRPWEQRARAAQGPPTQQCSLHLRPGRGRVQGRPLPAPRTPSLGTQAQGEWGSSALLGHYLSLRGSASTSLRMQPCQAHAREASCPRLCGTAAPDPPVPAPRRVLPPWVSGLQLCRP